MDAEFVRKLDRIAEDVAATRADTRNLKEYVQAVSGNVKEVRDDLSEHKEDVEAHGLKAARGSLGAIVSWLSLVVAAGALVVEFLRSPK